MLVFHSFRQNEEVVFIKDRDERSFIEIHMTETLVKINPTERMNEI
jgi:hypothetical protein